jgi:hypothetical protein
MKKRSGKLKIPMEFTDALSALLKVKPEAKVKKNKPRKKRGHNSTPSFEQ